VGAQTARAGCIEAEDKAGCNFEGGRAGWTWKVLSCAFGLVQEESQQVALGGDANSKSLDALTQLAKLAAARGARVGVDLTWAWLNGKNPEFPDFNNMQVGVHSVAFKLIHHALYKTEIKCHAAKFHLQLSPCPFPGLSCMSRSCGLFRTFINRA